MLPTSTQLKPNLILGKIIDLATHHGYWPSPTIRFPKISMPNLPGNKIGAF